jgi:hypothetical protein
MAEVLDEKTRVDDLLFISGHLIEILEQENIALTHNHLNVVNELLDQKTRLSRAYEIRGLGLRNSDHNFDGVDPDLLKKLKDQSERLQALVEINARELKIGVEVGRRYMDVLAESVKTATPSAGTYSASGTSAFAALGKKAVSPSVAIDENL